MESCGNRKGSIQGNYRSYNPMNHNGIQNENEMHCSYNGKHTIPAKEFENARNTKITCNNKKMDSSNNHSNPYPIAMAYVPWQIWGDLYDDDCALKQGTIFKDLNKIFCGVRF